MMVASIEFKMRLLVFLSTLIGAIFTPEGLQPQQLVLLLAFILNTQLRVVFLRDRGYLFSLIIDTALITIINYRFNGFSYLLYYIPVLSALLYLKRERYWIAGINVLFVMYFLRGADTEVIVLNVIGVASMYLLLKEYRGLSAKINEVEFLFDENRRYSHQLEIAQKRLQQYSSRVEELTQMEERQRISTEIHDTIGHRLTALLMQVEATLKLMMSDKAEGIKMLDSVSSHLREIIDILRNTVRNMKPKEYKGIISLQEIIDEFVETTGVKVSYEIYGIPFKIVPISELTLCKNLQEALTNSVRHGKAKNISVSLTYDDKKVVLKVKDDGAPTAKNIVKGMGLLAMEERIGLIGGTITYSCDKGFEVTSTIPVN